MRFLNVEFAPLRIPLERRLQTIAVLFCFVVHMGNVLIAAGLTYFFIFHTELWWLCIIYLIWIFFIDHEYYKNLGRRSDWVRNSSWLRYSRAYYPVTVKISPEKLNPKRNYLFCSYPHGLLATGISLGLGCGKTRKFYPQHTIHLHTLSMVFYLPFFRDLAIWLGIAPASKKVLNYLMGKPEGGNISILVVGGAEEALYFNPGTHKIVLRERKGFIKIALENGCSLVPVYSFGENEIFGQVTFQEGSFMRKIQRYFKELTGVALIFIKGRGLFQYTFGMIPHRRPIIVVVGEPIDVQKTESPTQEQIDNLHQLFQKKLVELFDSQKKFYLKDHETAQLEIC